MLRKVRDEHHLFYPEKAMLVMTACDLEHAACRAYKWLTYDRQSNGEVIPIPYSLCKNTFGLFPCHLPFSSRKEPWNLKITQVYLVPGGKYLVIWATEWLAVWELQIGARKKVDQEDPRPLSFIHIDAVHDQYNISIENMIVQPSPDIHGFRILVFFHVGAE